MIKIDTVVGNPPYNGPGQGRPPIYHTITDLVARSIAPDQMAWIVQYNWLTQMSPVGNIMRQSLDRLGVTLIEDNRFAGFDEATVRTCTIYTQQGHRGLVKLRDRSYQQSVDITPEEFHNLAQTPAYNPDERALLSKLRAHSVDQLGIPQVWTTRNSGGVTGQPYPRWAIAVTYFADFVGGGIGRLQILGPDRPLPGSQRVFQGLDNLPDLATAQQILDRMNSYWSSDLVKFVLSRTLTSRTLDNPQIAWVPVVPMDREWNSQELAQHFNLNAREQALLTQPRQVLPLTYQPNHIVTEKIAQIALSESQGRAVFRTADRKDTNGEVFTPTPLVLHMLTQLRDTAWEPGKTFLDPTCGNGQLLAAVAVVKRELGHANYLNDIYGIDLMPDNVAECRQRLLAIAGDTAENRRILERTVIQGNALDPQTYRIFNDHPLSIFEETV